MDTIVRIGGANGDGVDSTGKVLAGAFSRSGYHVNMFRSYQSVIRGGHVWANVRVAEEEVPSPGDGVDVLVAIDRQTAEVHLPNLREPAVIIHDADNVDLSDLDIPDHVTLLSIPAQAIAKDLGAPVVANVVALGAVARVVGLDLKKLESVIRDQFGHKGEGIIETNHKALQGGWEEAEGVEPIRDLAPVGDARPLIPGNEALALGSMAAGLTYYAAYPMTPASSILHYLADVGPEQGVVVKQVEDELGVVNSTIGAAFAGARAMCGTSGGGYALMTEALGMAGMAEVGIVVVNSMRGGPSTGLPTKTEQGDLWQMYGASQGEFPKVIIAPQDPVDAYETGIEAHEIADRYQLPVTVAMDLYVSETAVTVPEDAFRPVNAIDRGRLVNGNGSAPDDFKRYEVTDSGVSPRSIPGTEGLAYVAPSDEHDEHAELISDVRAGLPESLEIREEQHTKRLRKLDTLLEELPAPEIEGTEGPVLVCWGSTGPLLREARKLLAEEGVPTRQLTIKYVHPFHSDEVTDLLEGETWIMVEANATGQMEDYIRMRTSLTADGHVRRFDGEPFTPRQLVRELNEVIGA